MRIESTTTAVSWIPSEAIRGLPSLPFELGFGSYDEPPPDRIDDLAGLHAQGRYRFAQQLTAWVDVEDGRVTAYGHEGRSFISPTTMALGRTRVAFQPHAFPDVVPEPEVRDDRVTFRRSAGGRPGVPAPRLLRGRPFAQWLGPVVWTTLELTLHADGRADGGLVGATPFPRHWVYDADGHLVAKSGRDGLLRLVPHGLQGEHSVGPAGLPRLRDRRRVGAGAPAVHHDHARREAARRALDAGRTLVEQGDTGTDLFVLLDGVLAVEVDGDEVAQVGPGAVLGERAGLADGRRTSTLRAVTPCRVARARRDEIDPAALEELAEAHRREDADLRPVVVPAAATSGSPAAGAQRVAIGHLDPGTVERHRCRRTRAPAGPGWSWAVRHRRARRPRSG